MQFISDHPAGRAIDLGCGTGTNLITLATHGWQVTGVDFAPRAIALARRKVRAAGVQADLAVGDVTAIHPAGARFDLALDIGCFHGIDRRDAYLASLERLLAPAGFWLMYGFFKPSPATPGPGLEGAALDLIDSHHMALRSRTDGTDKRGRPSAWFLFQHQAPPPSGSSCR